MDFSTETIIEFGLNLAGYVVVALLVYILLRRRESARPKAKEAAKPIDSKEKSSIADTKSIRKSASPAQNRPEPEFMILPKAAVPSVKPVAQPVAAVRQGEPETIIGANRRENRRAIYREARRLLANGRSHNELLESLPITEDELEMLSVAGKA